MDEHASDKQSKYNSSLDFNREGVFVGDDTAEIINDSEYEFIESLIADPVKFEAFIYTPWRDAIKELEVRQTDPAINQHIDSIQSEHLPKQLFTNKNIAIARCLATPNYEMYRFSHFLDVLDSINPLILEFRDDKYVNVNRLKYAMAELSFHKSTKNGTLEIEKKSIINRNTSHGTKISDIETKQGGSFVQFHYDLFLHAFPHLAENIIDLSPTYASWGGGASKYYETYLSLFLRNTILFEDFLFSKEESRFTREIMLPAFISIMKKTGKKPLVVSIGPKGNEADLFWSSYPPHLKEFVENKLQSNDSGAV